MNYILQCPLDGHVELKTKDNFALKKKTDEQTHLAKLHLVVSTKPISNQELKHILTVTKKSKEDEQAYDQDEMTDSSQTETEEEVEPNQSPLNSDHEDATNVPTIVTGMFLLYIKKKKIDLAPPAPPPVVQPDEPMVAVTTTTNVAQPPPPLATDTKKSKNISQTFKELMKGLPFYPKKSKQQQQQQTNEENEEDNHHEHDEHASPRIHSIEAAQQQQQSMTSHLPSIFDQLERLGQCKEVVFMSGKSKRSKEVYEYYKTNNHAYFTSCVCVYYYHD